MNYHISINNFEGPLDLLLHLVKEMKMDIYEINTNIIIEEYLKYIHSLQELNIDIASDFLVMASELIHLKSKMLIGKSLEEEIIYQQEIVDKLKNYLDIMSNSLSKTKGLEYQLFYEIVYNGVNITKAVENISSN